MEDEDWGSRVEEWAAQWGIKFPFVITEAMAMADRAQRYGESLEFGGGWRHPLSTHDVT